MANSGDQPDQQRQRQPGRQRRRRAQGLQSSLERLTWRAEAGDRGQQVERGARSARVDVPGPVVPALPRSELGPPPVGAWPSGAPAPVNLRLVGELARSGAGVGRDPGPVAPALPVLGVAGAAAAPAQPTSAAARRHWSGTAWVPSCRSGTASARNWSGTASARNCRSGTAGGRCCTSGSGTAPGWRSGTASVPGWRSGTAGGRCCTSGSGTAPGCPSAGGWSTSLGRTCCPARGRCTRRRTNWQRLRRTRRHGSRRARGAGRRCWNPARAAVLPAAGARAQGRATGEHGACWASQGVAVQGCVADGHGPLSLITST